MTAPAATEPTHRNGARLRDPNPLPQNSSAGHHTPVPAQNARVPAGDAAASPAQSSSKSSERFLWVWIVVSTMISTAANATDSWLTAPPHLQVLAAARSFVPPIVILVTTHIAGLLIKSRRFGWPFVLSLFSDAAVWVFAFVLSYSSISHLMLMLGTPPHQVGLWPLLIDLSTANAVVVLFTLSYRRVRHPGRNDQDGGGDETHSQAKLSALRADVEPLSATQRRQWWDEAAAAVQERNQYVRAISERTQREVADVLRLTHDDALSQRAIADVVGLNSRIIRAIQRAGDELLQIEPENQQLRES